MSNYDASILPHRVHPSSLVVTCIGYAVRPSWARHQWLPHASTDPAMSFNPCHDMSWGSHQWLDTPCQHWPRHVHHQTNTIAANPSLLSTMTSPSTTQLKMWHRYSQSAPSTDGQGFHFRRRNTATYSKYDGAGSYHSGFAITSGVWDFFL